MPANNNPIFTAVADIQWAASPLITANTAKDGTGTVSQVFSADATNGGYVTKLTARSLGSNPATVLRLFVNNGASNTTPANNCLVAEMSMPATTLTETASQPPFELQLSFALPPGYRLLTSLGTAATAGFAISVIGGRY